MDKELYDDLWELNQKFESMVESWTTDVADKMKKFWDNSKLIVSGDADNPHTYTVKIMLPNYNYKDTESADFWDPFVRVLADSDHPKARHMPRNVWAKVEKDTIMSHDEDQRLPGFPVTTLYDYEDRNSKTTEAQLCKFSEKHGKKWEKLAEKTLNKLAPSFVDKYMNREVDYYPPSSISSPSATQWNIPLISPGAKTLQGKVVKVSLVVQTDKKCQAKFLIHANGWKKPTPNIYAEGIKNVWG